MKMNTAHIHEVIFLVQENDGKFSPDDLVLSIANKWGEDINFSSCSGIPFPKEEALSFLMDRNKVEINDDGKVIIHPTMRMCNSHLH